MREINIGMNEAGQRLDKLLRKIFRDCSDGFLYKMLRKKNILLNGRKASGKEKLSEGDKIQMYFSEESFFSLTKRKSDIVGTGTGAFSGEKEFSSEIVSVTGTPQIIYEDDRIIIVNKPAGFLSQGNGSKAPSLNEWCLSYLKEKGELDDDKLLTFRPGIVNRLDRNTSGLVIFGKTLQSLQDLSALIRNHRIAKEYVCVVSGRIQFESLLFEIEKNNKLLYNKIESKLKDNTENDEKDEDKTGNGEKNEIRIRGYLKKNRRKNQSEVSSEPFPGAVQIDTSFFPIYSGEKDGHNYTVLKVLLHTGRSHQIRSQLSQIGHPVLGDPKYGKMEENRYWHLKRQLLHAYKLSIPGNEMSFTASLPKDFDVFIPDKLRHFCL